MTNSVTHTRSYPTYIITQEPSQVPRRKGPFYGNKMVEDFLREAYRYNPEIICIVIDMEAEDNTWYPEHGYEWLDVNGDGRKRHPRKDRPSSPSPSTNVEADYWLEQVANREARRREILDWLQDRIGTAWTCSRCKYTTYHSNSYECDECGEEFPTLNLLAFKLHATGTDDHGLIEEVREELRHLTPSPQSNTTGREALITKHLTRLYGIQAVSTVMAAVNAEAISNMLDAPVTQADWEVERYRQALRRIADATAFSTNSASAKDAFAWSAAVAETALDHPPAFNADPTAEEVLALSDAQDDRSFGDLYPAPCSGAVVTEEMVKRGTSAILSRVPVGYGMTQAEAKAYSEAAIRAALAAQSTSLMDLADEADLNSGLQSPPPQSNVVTEAEIEAALKGWHDAITNAPDEGVDERRRRCIRAALTAARSAPAQIAAPQARAIGTPVDKAEER